MSDQVRNPATGYERTDVPLRLVGWLAAGLGTAIVLTPLLVAALFPAARRDAPPGPTALPPVPRLQARPAADLAAHRSAEERTLATYGWVDRASGAVRIPIEEAMKRVAREGIADWPASRR